MFSTIIIFIAVLSLLVFVHEMGHFWVARRFGLKPKEFGFGMPPRLFGIYKNKEGKWQKTWGNKEVKDADDTIYSVNWLPLGGFVNLGEDENPGDDANHFNNKSAGQRAIILLAGVTMNIILAMVLISFGFMIGLPQALHEDINPRAIISSQQIQVVEVMPNSPAKAAKLRMGDIIVGVNNENFINSDGLQKFAAAHAGEELNYKIKRGDEEIIKKITPEVRPETGVGGIGIGIMETGLVKYPVFTAIWEGIKTTILVTWAIIAAFYGLLKGLILGQGVGAEVAGPVGIAALTGQMARMGFVYLLQFTALLSINLAIINALPFPALDGGRILFIIIEKIKGSPVKKEIEGTIHYIGFAMLMLLVLFVTFKDVARFGGQFKALWEKIAG